MLHNMLRIVLTALCAWRALGEPVHLRLQLLKQRICSTTYAVAAALFGFLRTNLDPLLLRTRLALRIAM